MGPPELTSVDGPVEADALRRPGGRQVIPRPPVWTEERDAPWPVGARWTTDELVAGLPPAGAEPPLPTFPGAKVSAVLVALTDGEEGAEVLLTRRSMHLRNHRGEISFPGGRSDPGEDPIDTAVREAHEEVGLDPSRPEVVGELPHLSTVVSRSYIVPVVARLEDRGRLAARTAEADRVMWTPIAELTRPGTYHRERWGRPPLDRPLHFFLLDDETIWGATAHMLVQLLTGDDARRPSA